MHPHGQHSFAAVMNLGNARDALLTQQLRQVVGALGVGHRDDFRLVPFDLPDEFFEVHTRSQCHHSEPSGQRLHDREALSANRTRRAQDGELLHEVFRFPLRELKMLADLRPGRIDQNPIIPDNRNRQDESIDPVKHASMPG